jgi:hypothetical protein
LAASARIHLNACLMTAGERLSSRMATRLSLRIDTPLGIDGKGEFSFVILPAIGT